MQQRPSSSRQASAGLRPSSGAQRRSSHTGQGARAPKRKEPARALQAGGVVLGKQSKRFRLFSSRSGLDLPFLLLLLTLVVIGLIMLFSASYANAYYNTGSSFTYILRQGIFAVVGVGIAILLSYMDYHILRKFALVGIIASWGLLAVTLVLPATNHVHRWINLGIFTFQPSEIAKFALILWFAHYISLNFKKMNTFRTGIIPNLIVVAITVGLVVLEPHFSASIILLSISGFMLFIGGVKKRWFAIVLAVVAVGALVVLLSGNYATDRIMGWLNPFDPPTGVDTWQTRNSLYAIGSGGWMGVGLGQSRQKYLWLPEPQNDFIFAIVCEELGFVGALLIVLLFALLVWRGIVISLRAKDKFGMLLGVGLIAQVGIQVVLNIGVVTNTIPNTGISLPFFSYGGTALIIMLAQMGILLSISRSSTIEKT